MTQTAAAEAGELFLCRFKKPTQKAKLPTAGVDFRRLVSDYPIALPKASQSPKACAQFFSETP